MLAFHIPRLENLTRHAPLFNYDNEGGHEHSHPEQSVKMQWFVVRRHHRLTSKRNIKFSGYSGMDSTFATFPAFTMLLLCLQLRTLVVLSLSSLGWSCLYPLLVAFVVALRDPLPHCVFVIVADCGLS